MTKEKIDRLIKLHNTLMQIQVSGDNAILLSTCIMELRNILNEENKDKNGVELSE